ncbi:hypothetical protein JB92DRAFT_889852 [Gautieria morchelliformis]|nr:hypothetical protein JB92DRAFT_889852 [Gautieria morchelliformis]
MDTQKVSRALECSPTRRRTLSQQQNVESSVAEVPNETPLPVGLIARLWHQLKELSRASPRDGHEHPVNSRGSPHSDDMRAPCSTPGFASGIASRQTHEHAVNSQEFPMEARQLPKQASDASLPASPSGFTPSAPIPIRRSRETVSTDFSCTRLLDDEDDFDRAEPPCPGTTWDSSDGLEDEAPSLDMEDEVVDVDEDAVDMEEEAPDLVYYDPFPLYNPSEGEPAPHPNPHHGMPPSVDPLPEPMPHMDPLPSTSESPRSPPSTSESPSPPPFTSEYLTPESQHKLAVEMYYRASKSLAWRGVGYPDYKPSPLGPGRRS